MKNYKDILEIKDEILVDAILAMAINIIDVDVKFPHKGNVALYITTDNISAVNQEKLAEICVKYSSSEFGVKFLVPENKIITNKLIPNVDCVCIFITKFSDVPETIGWWD